MIYIGIHGPKRIGKDTFAKNLKQAFMDVGEPRVAIGSILTYCLVTLPDAVGLIAVVATIFGAVTMWRSPVAGRALVSYAAVAMVLAAGLAGSGAGEALTVRFAMFLLPLLCVFAAVALTGPWPRVVRILGAVFVVLGLVGATAVYLASFMQSPRDDGGAFINRELPASSVVLAPKSPGPYKTPAFDFSRLRLVSDPKAPHDFVVQVEDRRPPATPAGFELMAEFPKEGMLPPTPLSFSGRLVRIYRKK